MKIAIVGCGALGSFYGAKLSRIEPDVFFLLRSDYAHAKAQGVQVDSVDGSFHARPNCAQDPAAIGPYDLVLIGLKTTANDQFPRLLLPLVGPATLVATLQNGLGNEEALAALLGPTNILGGLCFVCVNRIGPSQIRHTAYGNIVLGESMGPYRASTLLDFEKGLPLELKSLFEEPLRQAQKAGVKTPRLAALCQVLTQLDQRRG
jgi:2-dehydropantoate 2-reductase